MSARQALERIDQFLAERHPGFERDPQLAQEARRLSEQYTAPDADAALHAASSVAYLAHFGPRAVAAVAHATRAWPRAPRTCIDVGAGSGASALALLTLGVDRVTLIERDAQALRIAKALLAPFSERVRLVEASVESAPVVDAEGIASAFSFGELALPPRESFALLERIAPRAQMALLVDAGDHARARRLQELRDALVFEEKPIAGPCMHRDPCPALVRARDWCHDRIEKHLPPRLAQFSAAVGRDAEHMSLSWLVVAERTQPDAIVVIGEPIKDKGRARIPVCGPGNVRFLQALKRHRDAHRALLDLERGTRLSPTLRARSTTDLSGTLHIEDPAILDG